MSHRVTVDWVREDRCDTVEENIIMLQRELGFATQRALLENMEYLDTAKTNASLMERLRGSGQQK